MSTRATSPTRARPILVIAKESKTANIGSPVDLQQLCSFGIERAVEIETASLMMVYGLNSCVLDFYKDALWFAPIFSNFLNMSSQALAFSAELQLNWLSRMLPHRLLHVENISGNQPANCESAHSMDIAIGERAA